MNTIDFTNIEQVKAAIMQHISNPTSDRWRQRQGMPDISDALSIAHRIEFQAGSLWRHAKLAAVEHCLFQLVQENRIAYLRHRQIDLTWREWYGPLPTTDEQRAAWAALREKVAARAALAAEPEEPAAEEGDE